MNTLKVVAKVIWALALLASIGVIAYFTVLGTRLWPNPNGFWSSASPRLAAPGATPLLRPR